MFKRFLYNDDYYPARAACWIVFFVFMHQAAIYHEVRWAELFKDILGYSLGFAVLSVLSNPKDWAKKK